MSDQSSVTMPVAFLRQLAAATSRHEVLEAMATWLPRVIDADRASITRVVDTDHLEVLAIGEITLTEGTRIPVDGSIAGAALRSLEPFIINDLSSTDFFETNPLSGDGLHSVLCCPIVHANGSLGTVNLASTTPQRFSVDDATAVSAIADLIGGFLAAHGRADSEEARARIDQLTGGLSRAAILELLDEQFAKRVPPSLLFIDVDRFKAINDRYGHSFGDAMLRTLADRIHEVLGTSGHLGRFGGDEFLVLVPADPDGSTAETLSTELAAACRAPIVDGPINVSPSISIGVASMAPATSSAADLLNDADQAMYAAKASRTIAIADDSIRHRAKTIATIDRDLELGFSLDQITYHFQPIRDLVTNEILGSEALVRWRHDRLGWVPPDLLIERIEDRGRIDVFTEWSLRAVASRWSEVRAALPHFHDKAVSINLSPLQLAMPGYLDAHLAVLDEFELRREDIIVELVESADISDAAEATLRALADERVIIALDDFGTGHNALGYFTRFPIHAVKFDRSLISLLGHDPKARAVVAGAVATCDELDVFTLGEGIETEDEARRCMELGLHHGQGWHLGHPVATDRFIEAALESHRPDIVASTRRPGSR